MKTPSVSRFRKGFTLIELLVVIAIIAVLAAAGFAGGAAAMNRARKVTAQAAATSVATAIDQFYSEYSSLPVPNVSNPPSADNSTPYSTGTATADGTKLLEVLVGIDQVQNERKVKFLSLKEAKSGNRDGVNYGGTVTTPRIDGLYDPWGQPYYLVLDYDYNERLRFTPQGSPNEVTLNGRRAAVYSLGVKNTADANKSTLVKTW